MPVIHHMASCCGARDLSSVAQDMHNNIAEIMCINPKVPFLTFFGNGQPGHSFDSLCQLLRKNNLASEIHETNIHMNPNSGNRIKAWMVVLDWKALDKYWAEVGVPEERLRIAKAVEEDRKHKEMYAKTREIYNARHAVERTGPAITPADPNSKRSLRRAEREAIARGRASYNAGITHSGALPGDFTASESIGVMMERIASSPIEGLNGPTSSSSIAGSPNNYLYGNTPVVPTEELVGPNMTASEVLARTDAHNLQPYRVLSPGQKLAMEVQERFRIADNEEAPF